MSHDRRVLEQLGLRARQPRRRLSATAALRRITNPLEGVVQAQGSTLLRSLQGKAYTVGNKRKRGDHPGTMQGEGLGDVWFFLPAPRFPRMPGTEHDACSHPNAAGWAWNAGCGAGWWEAKRTGETRSPKQIEFGDWCLATATPYVWGDLDALFAWLVAGGWLVADNLAHYRRPAAPAPPQEG